MKRILLGLMAALLMFAFVPVPDAPGLLGAQECAKIKDGTITDTANNPVRVGYDAYGYNYQARIFNGTYDSSDRSLDGLYFGGTGDYVEDSLIMKWSDDWLSNLDCTGDGKLDRDGATNISKGWLTNQIEGDYLDGAGDSHHYTYFAKIVYDASCAPTNSCGLWNKYTIIEEVYNDPDGGYHGVDRNNLVRPAGFGFHTNN